MEANLVLGQEARADVTDTKPFCGERLPPSSRARRAAIAELGAADAWQVGLREIRGAGVGLGAIHCGQRAPSCDRAPHAELDAPVTPSTARLWETERIHVTLSTRWMFES